MVVDRLREEDKRHDKSMTIESIDTPWVISYQVLDCCLRSFDRSIVVVVG